MARRWYVVHTYSGHENKVKLALEKTVEVQGMEESVGKVVIPTEMVTEMKNGKRTVSTRKFFPTTFSLRWTSPTKSSTS